MAIGSVELNAILDGTSDNGIAGVKNVDEGNAMIIFSGHIGVYSPPGLRPHGSSQNGRSDEANNALRKGLAPHR